MLSHTKFQDVDNNLPVYPMKGSRSWSHTSGRTNDKISLKKFSQFVQKQH